MKRTLLTVMLLGLLSAGVSAQSDDATLVERLKSALTPTSAGFHLGLEEAHLGIDTFAKAAAPPPPAEVTAMIEQAAAPSIDLTINFAFGSSELTPKSQASLDALAQAMNDATLSGYGFLVAGHTDAKGTDAFNDQLSFERASSVVRYLAYYGHVDPRRLAPYAFGEHQLKDSDDPEGAINRRVQFVTIDAAAASN